MTSPSTPIGSRSVTHAPGSHATVSATARGMLLALAAALLAVMTVAPPIGAPILLSVLVIVFAWGWPHLIGIPGAVGSSVVVGLVGLAAVIGSEIWDSARPVVPAVGIGVLAAFVQQMLRKDGREHLVDAVTGTVSGLVIAGSGAAWVTIGSLDGGAETLLVASAAMCAGALAHFLRAAEPVVVSAIVLGAALVGLGTGSLLGVSLIASGAVGLALGGLMGACYTVFSVRTAPHPLSVPAAALAPLLAIGLPVMQAVHLLNRAM